MKNLFIIGTPLQLLNAIEAVKHFGLTNNVLVIVHRSLAANALQMEYVKNLYKWDEILEIAYSRHSSIMQYVNLIKRLRYDAYNYIFISKLEVVPKLAIANLSKQQVYLLDDGLLTISIYDNQLKKGKLNRYDFKELRFLIFGLKIKVKSIINLFTAFDLEPIGEMKVVKNEFSFLANKYLSNATVDDKAIYVLGHPSNEKLVTNKLYIENLYQLLSKYDKNIVYIPHRAQTQEVKQLLSEIDNPMFSILEINMPVELYFLENKIYPTHIISYYSTALITLYLIYKKCKVSYIFIPNGAIINKDLIGIYKAYSESGFEELHLNRNSEII